MADNVNHPAHYETGKFECIDVMVEVFGAEKVAAFCECNAFKYLYRCENKHETPQEDWKKARWYLNKALELTWQETAEKPLAAGGTHIREGIYAKEVSAKPDVQIGTVLVDISEYLTAEEQLRLLNEDVMDVLYDALRRRKENKA